MLLNFVAVLVGVLSCIYAASGACTINVNGDLSEPQPLLLRPGTSQIIYPSNRSGIVNLNDNEAIELFCSSGFDAPTGANNSIIATCSANNQFLFNATSYKISNFACKGFVAHVARRTGARCYNNATVIEHGFPVGTDRFVKVYDVCHDEVSEANYYAAYKLTPANDGFQNNYPRPNFITGGYFGGKNVDSLYTRNLQRSTLSLILSSTDLALKYIEETSDVYSARGHMAAKCDFIYGNEQRATFYFTNTMPQWQTFNAINWAAVEDGTRVLAADRNINLDVYTGTWGVIELKDINGVPQPFYLSIVGAIKKIPVPKLYYRIIINKADNSGVVLIGVNNPHLTLEEIKKDYIVCTDVSSQIKYISWQKEIIAKGYSYACAVNDFVKVVPHVQVSASKLLV